MIVDAEMMKQAIEDSAALVKDEQASVLPHPSITNKNLHEHLAAVSFHPYAVDTGIVANGDMSLRDKASRTKAVANFHPGAQKAFNHSLVQLLHQFEHRTRRQEMEIQRLRSSIVRLEALIKASTASD